MRLIRRLDHFQGRRTEKHKNNGRASRRQQTCKPHTNHTQTDGQIASMDKPKEKFKRNGCKPLEVHTLCVSVYAIHKGAEKGAFEEETARQRQAKRRKSSGEIKRRWDNEGNMMCVLSSMMCVFRKHELQ